jgi:uncharacterized protein YuzE
MRWEFEAETGSLYVYLRDEPVDHQEEMPDGLIVDVGSDDHVVGIEVLSAWAPFNFKMVAQRFDLSEQEATSLDFLYLSLISRIGRRVAKGSSPQLQAQTPTSSSTPARVLTPA